MICLSGLSVKDHLLACNLNTGVKTPVTERRGLMDRAYRLGRELLA